MTENLEKLEREVERELGRWSERLEIRLAGGLVESVRVAVRSELGGAWLAGQPAPSPDPAVVERVRAAVAVELSSAGASPLPWPRRWFSSPGLASLGAAAMLLLCIGVIWYAGTLGKAVSTGEVDRFLAAAPNSSVDLIREQVKSLELNLPRDKAFPQDEDESLEDLVREMDQLLDRHEPAKGTWEIGLNRSGALG